MLILQVVEKALEISPYNSVAFGVLVAVLIVACGGLWVRLNQEQKLGRETITKTTELMTKIYLFFEEDKGEDKALREAVKEVLLEIRMTGKSRQEQHFLLMQKIEQLIESRK